MIKQRVLALHSRGLTAKVIAADVGLSVGHVYKTVHAAGRSRHVVRYRSVLERLSSANGPLKANEIAVALGVSRQNVQHAIENLRADGHVIEARVGPKGGYKLIKQEAKS